MDFKIICDSRRHLVTLPYSKDNMHKMAKALGISKSWFHNSTHYDMPIKKIDEIHKAAHRCVTTKQIVLIIQGKIKNFEELCTTPQN